MFERLKARGEEVFNRVAGELMSNPTFVKALQGAMKGKEKLDKAAGRALKQMNIPTRSEFKRALERIEALEGEVEALRQRAKARPRSKRRRRATKTGARTAAPAPETAPAAEVGGPAPGLEEAKGE